MHRVVPCRAATPDDLDAMTETLVLAFTEDPIWGGWAFPDRSRSAGLRRAFFRFWLEGALRHGAVRVTEGCEAVASWYPPEGSEYTEEEERTLASMSAALLGDGAALLLDTCALIEDERPRTPPAYYLSMLGTHDAHRGRGLGMDLLRESLARLDARGMPAYLESTNPRNNARYGTVGFVSIGSYALSGGGPRIEKMWREPRPEGRESPGRR